VKVIVRDFVHRRCKDLFPNSRKEDMARCAQISYPLVELVLWLCAQEQRIVRSLKNNKEAEVGGCSPTLG
jgi:hypothetical protein